MAFDDTTHDKIEKRLADLDLAALAQRRRSESPSQPYFPSPASWEDELLYFLMVDRFADGREADVLGNDGRALPSPPNATPPFDPDLDAYQTNRDSWREKGGRWCGGTLRGLRSRLGYLRRMGVTTVWLSPIFKQVGFVDCYHGYAVQNFLDVDPHFGTRRDLKDMVAEAHRLGMRVILDIVISHAGNVFAYAQDRPNFPAWDGTPYRVVGFRDALGNPCIPPGPVDVTAFPKAWPDGAIWPAEFQAMNTFSRKGEIYNWGRVPECFEGDVYSHKAIEHGFHERAADGSRIVYRFNSSPALQHLIEVYKFWIAYADVDGFRVCSVHHVETGAMQRMVVGIKEFAQTLGKENFLFFGEIRGNRAQSFATLEQSSLDAALGVEDLGDSLEFLAKGFRDPADYFGLFRNSAAINKGSHAWYGQHLVTMFDDPDKIGRRKVRFCADVDNDAKVGEANRAALPVALAINLLGAGIPCVYYGSEQYFDGAQWRGERDRMGADDDGSLRECMFGGPFGSFQSERRHFFNDRSSAYRLLADLAAQRKALVPLRRGRQYLRPISASGDEGTFGYPTRVNGQLRSVVPWSRIYGDSEILVAVNTDVRQARAAWVTVDNMLHRPGTRLRCRFSTDPNGVGRECTVEARNGAAVYLQVPPGGCVIFQ